jgi:protein-L-isoaspartate(D-aspartate) O-methyltransferase
MLDFALQRRMMVDSQLRPFDVNDIPLLEAMNAVPRERFVVPGREDLAYMDKAILAAETPERRWMLSPMMLARLIQHLEIRPGERVLDVACGLGYSSAVLAALGATVTGLESSETLAAAARERLRSIGATGVSVVSGPLDQGYAAGAPYDAILINGSIERRPSALLQQLADGGRLACIRGSGPAGKVTIHVRTGDAVGSREISDGYAPALEEFREERGFVF